MKIAFHGADRGVTGSCHLVECAGIRVQEEEAARRSRRAERKRDNHPVAPLYTTLDALDSCDRFGRTAQYATPIDLARGVRATFPDAGHILGSANVLPEIEEGGRRRRVLFSGDLGSPGRQRDLRRVCRARHSRAPHHRRSPHRDDLWRADPRACPHPHDRRLLGARGSGGAPRGIRAVSGLGGHCPVAF
jgi:hypothetical protein